MSKRNKVPGKAIAVAQPGAQRQGKSTAEPRVKPSVVRFPEPQSVMVPAALMLACEACSATKGLGRPIAEGVYLHAKDGVGRAVATDGVRILVGSFTLPKKKEGGTPEWLKHGLILS